MIKRIILLLTLIIYFSCNKTDSPEIKIHNFIKTVSGHHSIDYDIRYRIKFYSSDDTLDYKVHCSLIKKPEDSIFGGAIWIDNDSIERVYDLKNIYVVNHKLKTITVYSNPSKQKWAINNWVESECFNIYFFHPEKLANYFNRRDIHTAPADTMVENEDIVFINFVNKKKHYSRSIELTSKGLRRMRFYVKDIKQDATQYNEWDLYNIKYDNVDIQKFNNKLNKYKKTYTVKKYIKPPERKLLKQGGKVPDFAGIIFPEQKKIDLYGLKNKITLIDFFYIDCDYCIQSIPILNELHEKYSKKGLKILGLNPINGMNDSSRLIKYIINNKITYPVILINKETAIQYNVLGFPTFYLIDENNKVIFARKGYRVEIEDSIKRIIQRNL